MTNQLALLIEKPYAIDRWQPAKTQKLPPNEQSFNLRPYQKKVIGEVYNLIREGYKQPLIYAPTGSGKTVIASHITKDALKRDRRVLFLVHRDALVSQTVDSLVSYGIDKSLIGYIKAGHPHAGDEHQVIVASIQSLARREFPSNIGLIVVDEAHTTAFYSTYQKVKEAYLHDGRTGAIAIGLSASPWRAKAGQGMKDHFDAIAIAATISDLIKDGYLAQPRYFGFGGLIDISQFETGYDGDFKTSQVNAATMAAGFNERIVKEFKELCPERTAIAFCSSVEQSRHLAQLFNDAGITAEHLEAATPTDERQGMYERLKSGKTRILSSVGTLTEGFDVKSIGAVILARPTKSVALYVQMCGRGLRSFPNKEDCYILDFGDNCKRLGFLSEQPEPTLEPLKQKKPPQLKECPNCHEMILSMLRVCPHCGEEFSGEGEEDSGDSENLFEEKFGELFDSDTREKVKYFRAEVKRRFTKGQPRDRAWELYLQKFNEHPINSWLEGAVFHGNNTQFNQERFVEYLNKISQVQPPSSDWINFHLKIEFGDKLIKTIIPEYGMKWHEILQVTPQASLEEIKAAYRKLATKHHPDTGGSDEVMKLINCAFDRARRKP